MFFFIQYNNQPQRPVLSLKVVPSTHTHLPVEVSQPPPWPQSVKQLLTLFPTEMRALRPGQNYD
jgi:hypothetical protein